MNPDAVYTLLVEADPVPDPDIAMAATPELRGLRRRDIGSETMTLTARQTDESTSPTPRPHRWILAAAAAAIVLLGLGVFALVRDDPESAEPADAPAPTLPAPPSRADAAINTSRTYLTALFTGDAETVTAMADPIIANAAAEGNLAEMNGIAYPGDERPTVGRCTTADVGAGDVSSIEVACEVTYSDPVHEELGTAEVVMQMRVGDDGTIAWVPGPSEVGDLRLASQAYADYLRTFHAAEFQQVCSPLAYEAGTVHASANLALAGACAELWAPLSEDVAQWVRDGRPDAD